jgi:hypothetical protein
LEAAFSGRQQELDFPSAPLEEVHVDLVAGFVEAGHVGIIGEEEANESTQTSDKI